jgi:hypothetical protein
MVRVAKRTIGKWRKACTFKKFSYMKIWLYELFKVAEIMHPTKTKASLYKFLGPDSKLINCWFLCQDLLKIDPKKLLKEVKYLVKWYGYGDHDNTWESAQESFQGAIDEYEAKKGEEQPQESKNVPIASIDTKNTEEPIVLEMPKVVKHKGKPVKKPVARVKKPAVKLAISVKSQR